MCNVSLYGKGMNFVSGNTQQNHPNTVQNEMIYTFHLNRVIDGMDGYHHC